MNTFDHNVVIFCEKCKYISKKNNDAKNTDREYEINNTDEESANSSNYTKYDNVLSDDTYLKNRREQLREIIRNITHALFYRCVLLKAMTYDVKACQKEWAYCESKISSLKSSIDKLHLCKKYLPHRCLKEKAKQNIFIAKIQILENKLEKSSYSPLYFLSLIKKTRIPEKRDNKACTKHSNIFLNKSLFRGEIVLLLSKFKRNDREIRYVGNEHLMKCMIVPELQKSFTVTGLEGCDHISYATQDRLWVSHRNHLMLASTEDSIVYHKTDLGKNAYTGGIHAINNRHEIIYVDKYKNVNKISNDLITKTVLIKQNDTT